MGDQLYPLSHGIFADVIEFVLRDIVSTLVVRNFVIVRTNDTDEVTTVSNSYV